tara:strand:- start:239 stop:1780 length:1542 start_codon:yes stop_codon:yes gene_type:complete
MPYIGRGSEGFGIRERYQYTATSGQTAFTGSDINSKTLKFDNGSLIDVLLNGVMLKPTTDWTSSGSTVTLTSGASTSDEVMIIVYDVFVLSDAMPKTGGTFSDNVTFNADITVGDDIILNSDSSVIHFGADSDVTITHDPDDGLILKSKATADDNPVLLTLQTGETDIALDDVLGTINFQAPDEATGTDAQLVAAGISAISEGDFSSSVNNTSLVFKTGYSETATEKMRIMAGGAVAVGIQSLGDTHNLAAIGGSPANDEGVVVRGSNGGCINVVNSSNSDDDFLGQFGFCNLANDDAGAVDADGQTVAWVRARTITSDSNSGDDSGAYLQFVACAESSGVAEVGRLDPSITRFVGATTSTGNSANAQIDGNGRLHTSTSSKIYKTAIEDLEDEYADKIFSLEPKFYKSNTETVNDDTTKLKPDWSFYGLLAEDVAKVEPRLVTFKLTEMNKKDDGSVTYETKELDTPVPVSVNYDRITMHLINIVKRFKTRIETLESSNADLIKRVEALEKA